MSPRSLAAGRFEALLVQALISSLFCNPGSGAKDLLAGSSDNKSRLSNDYCGASAKILEELGFPGHTSLISEP